MTVEGIIIRYLISKDIPGIGTHVYAEKPVDPDDAYVVVSRSGGSTTNMIDTYLVHTDLHVKRDEEAGYTKLLALNLHEAVIWQMEEIIHSTELFMCRKNSDYDAALPGSEEYRYQALWEITL